MVNYQNGKIYKITGGNSLPYIGSTSVTLSRRFSKHKIDKTFYLKHNKSNKCASFDLLDFEDCKIELIELFPCNTKRELEIRERHWFDLIPNININKPYISTEEIAKKQKINYEKNKEHILEQCRINRKKYTLDNMEKLYKSTNCSCGLHYTYVNRRRHFRTKTHLAYLATINNIDNIQNDTSNSEEQKSEFKTSENGL